jgi:hypothetical protein
MENFFGNSKEEALRQFPIPIFQEAQQSVEDYIAFYNYESYHENKTDTFSNQVPVFVIPLGGFSFLCLV